MGFKTTLLKKVVVSAAHIILTYTTTQNFLLKSQRVGPSSRLPRDLLVVGNQQIHDSFIHKNCFELHVFYQFLQAY